MLGSYSYLGLSDDPRICQRAKVGIDQFGVGLHGTRITSGTMVVHERLESRIAEFLGADAAMVIGSGLVTNTSVIQCLASKGDTIFYDRDNHASLHDGCRISGATLREFSHDDLDALGEMLDSADADKGGLRFVIVDSVFSMDGDVLDLPKLLAITKPRGAVVMIDEAHSFGVLGATGRGITEYYGIKAHQVDILMGVISKAIPAVGGFIAGTQPLIRALKATCHGFIFSAALPPSVLEAARAAIDVLEMEPWRISRIHANVARYLKGLHAAGIDTHRAGRSAIVPILCRSSDEAFAITKFCRDHGVIVTPAIYPVVPINMPRVRTTMTAAMDASEVDLALEVVIGAVRSVGR
jgi:glycine C-acetyltransferase